MYDELDPGPVRRQAGVLMESEITIRGIKRPCASYAVADFASPVGAIEREGARFQLRNAGAIVRAGELLGKEPLTRHLTVATTTRPSASFSAVPSEFSSRCSMPGFTSRRSTTTSMVWFLRLSSLIGSSIRGVRRRFAL